MEFDTLTIAAKIETLNEVTDFVENHADRHKLDATKKFSLLVALEEAFVNICCYAYPEGEGNVELACGGDDEAFVLEISDNGKPFDILSLPVPDITQDIMDREIGGLGVHFIRKLSDNVSYRRENGQNKLRILFRRSQDTSA